MLKKNSERYCFGLMGSGGAKKIGQHVFSPISNQFPIFFQKKFFLVVFNFSKSFKTSSVAGLCWRSFRVNAIPDSQYEPTGYARESHMFTREFVHLM